MLAPVSAQEKPAPRVILGFASGSPGSTVTMPFSLEGARGRNVGRIVTRIRFPANHLSFLRLEKAALLEGDAAVETTWQVRDPGAASADRGSGRDGKTKVSEKLLELRVSSRRAGTPLVDGILTYLVFRIEPRTVPEKTPELLLSHETRIFAADVTDQDPPLAAVSEQAKILVGSRRVPIISCFFYMH